MLRKHLLARQPVRRDDHWVELRRGVPGVAVATEMVGAQRIDHDALQCAHELAHVAEPAPFNSNDDSPQPELGEFLDEMKVGGLGIHFMRKLMDEVRYNFDPEKGNELTIVKNLDGGDGQ